MWLCSISRLLLRIIMENEELFCICEIIAPYTASWSIESRTHERKYTMPASSLTVRIAFVYQAVSWFDVHKTA